MSSTTNGNINYSIQVDGNKIDNTSPVFSITVNKTINKIPYATILIYDGSPSQAAFSAINSKTFEIGSTLEISLGYQSDSKSVFKGIITKQTLKANGYTPSYLEVCGKDVAYQTTIVPKTAGFSDMTDSDIIKKILGNYSGISTSMSSTTTKYEALAQQDVTDWDFINMRAEANGFIVLVDDGKTTIQKPSNTQSPQSTFTYGTDIYGIDLEMDASTQWDTAGGKIWDPSSQQSQDVSATQASESSFGAVSYDKLTSASNKPAMSFLHAGTITEDEMKTFSTSLLQLNRLSKIRGSITVQGVADIKPDSVIKIDKGADNFQGNAYVSGVQHHVEAGQWTTKLIIGLPSQRYMRRYVDIAGFPAAGMLPPVYGLQIGTVEKLVSDPQSAYRIFVNLRLIHQSGEGIWCRIASFYASNGGVGAVIMPEEKDEVIVGFINDDFRSPVVIGSLYSSKNTTPIQLDEKNAIKTFVTKSKLELTFQEEDKSITIQTPGGRSVIISDKEESITITNGSANTITLGKQDVEIKCNQNITLNAQKGITLQAADGIELKANNDVNISGMNVSNKAQMKASVVGSSSAELQSSGTTVVKGTMVQIN